MTSSAVTDHELRSRYVRDLLTAPHDCSVGGTIPRRLVQFWDDASDVPRDVQECIDSWLPLEAAGFDRLLFDDKSAKSFISDYFERSHLLAFERCVHPAMRSDYFRLCYMSVHGGIYVDADDVFVGSDLETLVSESRLKLHPLCYDIARDSMVDTSLFLLDPPASSNLIYYVNNNPLIAPAGHPLIHKALGRATRALLARSTDLRDIQSVAGPGNLTASLVQHAIDLTKAGEPRDFEFLTEWDNVAVSRWPLEYRNDDRNWRRWRTDAPRDSA